MVDCVILVDLGRWQNLSPKHEEAENHSLGQDHEESARGGPACARARLMVGLLQAALTAECQQLLPAPSGPQLSYFGLALLVSLVFLLGVLFGALCAGASGWLAWRYWSNRCEGGARRLLGYKLD